MTTKARVFTLTAFALLLAQAASAPPARAIGVPGVPQLVYDPKAVTEAIATVKKLDKQLSLYYDNIRYLDPKRGNYIRGLVYDSLDLGSCGLGDHRWSAVANRINKKLNTAYNATVRKPLFSCGTQFSPSYRRQHEDTEAMDMAAVNGFETLAAIRTNIASAEVQRTWLTGQVANVSKTGRAQTALLQKISVATTDTQGTLVEIQRGNAAILEQLLIANKLARDQRMTELNREHSRQIAMNHASQLILVKDWNW